MAITDKEQGVWGLDQVYNKINQGSIWEYTGLRELWAWGENGGNMILGTDDETQYSSPKQIPGTIWKIKSFNADGAADQSFAIRTDGTMWTWGNGTTGRQGQNNTTQYKSPRQLGTETTWGFVVSGNASSMATKTDGTLWIWGSNSDGQLGQNSPGPSQRSSPIQIPGTTWDYSAYDKISMGSQTGYGIKTDGTLWGWGNGGMGQLGQNNTTTYSSPIQIGTDTTWNSVAMGYQSGAGIKTDGTLWVWGENGDGRLAINNNTNYSSPIQVPGTTWKHCQLTNRLGIATKTDGTLWVWGDNAKGNLGQNNTTNYSSPKQIPGTDWNYASVGSGRHIVASQTNGELWACGSNNNGQLGQNSKVDYSSPVQIPGTTWERVVAQNSSSWGIRFL